MKTDFDRSAMPADPAVWKILYERQFKAVQQVACSDFMTGLQKLGLSPNRVPSFSSINETLETLTGWTIYEVPGLIDNAYFFRQLAAKKFGATAWLRQMEELDYLEEPDMFHDVFGHIPMLTERRVAGFLSDLARVASRYEGNEDAIEKIARLYWYTIEFGLVTEAAAPRIYGSGIISSIGETAFCLSSKATRIPFDIDHILSIPYIKDKFQEQYFVLDSLDRLNGIVPELEDRLAKI